MNLKIKKHIGMKRFSVIAVSILVAAMLTLIQCKKENKVPYEEPSCEGIMCTDNFESVSLMLKYPDNQPVLLDSSKVFWVSTNCFLEQDLYSWNEMYVYGNYLIVDDRMQEEFKHKQEIIHFIGYLNNEIVYEQDVLVGADCCHVGYLGAEPLPHIIDGISDEVRERKFCELVSVEHIRAIIPSYTAFISTVDENVAYENKLQLIADWFMSHDCITDAHIDCVLCVPTYPDRPNNSRIAFSFVENGQTINMVMLVTGGDARFAGLIQE